MPSVRPSVFLPPHCLSCPSTSCVLACRHAPSTCTSKSHALMPESPCLCHSRSLPPPCPRQATPERRDAEDARWRRQRELLQTATHGMLSQEEGSYRSHVLMRSSDTENGDVHNEEAENHESRMTLAQCSRWRMLRCVRALPKASRHALQINTAAMCNGKREKA